MTEQQRTRSHHNPSRTFVSNRLVSAMDTRVRTLTLIPRAGLVALTLVAASFSAVAQSASFTVTRVGKQVGTASFSFTPRAESYASNSLVRVSMQGLNYAFSKTEQLSASHALLHVQLSATINTSAVTVVAKPEGAQYLINISANGRSTTTPLAKHDAVVFLPDFDPGALETLLELAVQNNGRNLWAIIPKQAGSIVPVQIATYRDEQGTLNGAPVTVHHLVATISGAATDLFSGPENQLLQAELPQDGFALVRSGFVLTPPSRPTAAPPPQPPDQNPPNQYPQAPQ